MEQSSQFFSTTFQKTFFTTELATKPLSLSVSSAKQLELIAPHIVVIIAALYMLAVVHKITLKFCLSLFQVITVWQELKQYKQGCIVCLTTSPKTYGIFLSCTHRGEYYDNSIFGIPIEIEVVVPKLSAKNEIIYMEKSWELADIEIPMAASFQTEIFKGIAPIVKQRFEVNAQIKTVEEHYSNVKAISSLVQNSELYASYSEIYSKVSQRHSAALTKLKDLRFQLDGYVRESLIAIKLDEFEAKNISVMLAVLDTQLQTLQQEYQETKDFIGEYLKLKHDVEIIE